MGTAGSIVTLPNPKEYEWWGMGPAVMFHADRLADEAGRPRPSRHLARWYEIHDPIENPDGSPGFRVETPEYWDWLKSLDCPVYMHAAEPEIPNAVEFPAEKLRRTFGALSGGSASWMTMHAMYEHCMGDRIGSLTYPGVHLSHDEEYHDEARGLCFLMGWATGLGINVECFDILLPIRNYAYDAS